jgi:hypothetical protein
MSRIPIKIQKFKTSNYNSSEFVNYLFIIEDGKKTWDLTYQCSRGELEKFKVEIEKILADTSIAEILSISNGDAEIVEKHHKTDDLCKACEYKMTGSCVTCLLELDSPLERKLFLELKRNYIKFNHQYGLDWKGNSIQISGRTYNNPTTNFKEVLTIADFYIEKSGRKLCVYTDGHTYHERTEGQAQHDRNIDRKLQELGFQVLRYTGKDVNENIEKIIFEIKSWVGR